MKNILCYGDSILRGFIPTATDGKISPLTRYQKNKRWTGVLQNKLGEKFNVIEEGLNGRTTTLDEITPGRPCRDGLAQLSIYLESHSPLDFVIFLLGINDTKRQFKRSSVEITEGMRQIVKAVKTYYENLGIVKPGILVIAPQPIVPIANLCSDFDVNSIKKSLALPRLFQEMTKEEGEEFLDASQVVRSSLIDGIHLEESQCELLGNAIASKIRDILK